MKDLAFTCSFMSMNFLFFVLLLPFFVASSLQVHNVLEASTPCDYSAFTNQLFGITNWGNNIFATSRVGVAPASS
jgi:hypothetical protein